MTAAVVTVASEARRAHVARQQAFLARTDPEVARVLVWVDEAPPVGDLGATQVRHLPPGAHGKRIGAARNLGAATALGSGATTLVFLDADCLPHPALVTRYAEVTRDEGLWCGDVTYLDEGVLPDSPAAVSAHVAPHPARPALGEHQTRAARDDEWPLFWSLSFACSAPTWRRLGFDERYEGYGAEDTDLAAAARRAGVPLAWTGGAHAVHQHHPTSSPPWQHLDDILRNGAIYAAKWGEWPMRGWLDAFAAAGAIRFDGGAWVRV